MIICSYTNINTYLNIQNSTLPDDESTINACNLPDYISLSPTLMGSQGKQLEIWHYDVITSGFHDDIHFYGCTLIPQRWFVAHHIATSLAQGSTPCTTAMVHGWKSISTTQIYYVVLYFFNLTSDTVPSVRYKIYFTQSEVIF